MRRPVALVVGPEQQREMLAPAAGALGPELAWDQASMLRD